MAWCATTPVMESANSHSQSWHHTVLAAARQAGHGQAELDFLAALLSDLETGRLDARIERLAALVRLGAALEVPPEAANVGSFL